jgi:1-phosphofructokinase
MKEYVRIKKIKNLKKGNQNKMIYTVTFNPAIDYIVRMDKPLDPGMTNRSVSEDCFFGGKGINVSTILKNLNIENTALGFAAGFTGEAIVKSVKSKGIIADFIMLDNGISRINVKIKSGEETEINAQGPYISEDELNKLFEKLNKLAQGDILILAGSIPNSLPSNVYEIILERLKNREIMSIVDATGDLLKNVLKYHPFLIKPNNYELGEMFGKVLNSDDELFEHAKMLQEMGARNVLISMAGNGSMLVTENGERYRENAPKGKVKNSVGAGDSMVAGFIAGYIKTRDYQTALKLGIAAGSATAFSEDLATGDFINDIYKSIS